MKTIHHIIAYAVDAGLAEIDAENLASELYSTDKPLKLIDERIALLESQIGDLRKRYEALREIRGKWGVFNSEDAHHNTEDRLRP